MFDKWADSLPVMCSTCMTCCLHAASFSEWPPAAALPVFSMMVPRISATAVMVRHPHRARTRRKHSWLFRAFLSTLRSLIPHRSSELTDFFTVQRFWCSQHFPKEKGEQIYGTFISCFVSEKSCWFLVILLYFTFVNRLQTRQRVSLSQRERLEWPPWRSLLSRPFPHLSSLILASEAPQLPLWLQVRDFFLTSFVKYLIFSALISEAFLR